VLLATLMGGVGGCGLVLLYDRFDDIVEAPDDLEPSPDALFGTIPEWEAPMVPAAEDGEEDWPGVAAPFSPAAEAYRHVATNVRLGVPHSVSTLLVTSPGAREGKTTTAANLGVALSEAGRDVLLVDADLQGPSLHRMFGAEVPRPALLLQEDHVRPLLRALTDEWDVVLFDTPPTLLYDDAFRLASLTDLVLLLAAAGETRRSAFRDVRTRLDTVSPHGVAALLNRHRATPGTSYGYSYYSYASYPEEGTDRAEWTRRVSRGVRRLVKG